MELYKIGSIFLDISIGLIVISAIIRLIQTLTYFKRNGSKTLTAAQRHAIKKIRRPLTLTALLLALASLLLLLL